MSAVRPPGNGTPGATPGAAAPGDKQRLKAAVQQLEGVFVEQLFKAMRETIPKESLTSGGSAEEMFVGLFDQQMANRVPQQWEHGLGEALIRQLEKALPPEATDSHPSDPDVTRKS